MGFLPPPPPPIAVPTIWEPETFMIPGTVLQKPRVSNFLYLDSQMNQRVSSGLKRSNENPRAMTRKPGRHVFLVREAWGE